MSFPCKHHTNQHSPLLYKGEMQWWWRKPFLLMTTLMWPNKCTSIMKIYHEASWGTCCRSSNGTRLCVVLLPPVGWTGAINIVAEKSFEKLLMLNVSVQCQQFYRCRCWRAGTAARCALYGSLSLRQTLRCSAKSRRKWRLLMKDDAINTSQNIKHSSPNHRTSQSESLR